LITKANPNYLNSPTPITFASNIGYAASGGLLSETWGIALYNVPRVYAAGDTTPNFQLAFGSLVYYFGDRLFALRL